MNALGKFIFISVSALILSAGCAKKLDNGRGGASGGRFAGEGDACDNQGYFYDIPGYEESTVSVIGAGTYNVGDFTLTPMGSDRFTLRSYRLEQQIVALTLIYPDIVSLGTYVPASSAKVRIYLYSSCSPEDQPMVDILDFNGTEEFYLGQLTSQSVNIQVSDPYRYDVFVIEYIGEAQYVNGQQGQTIPYATSPTWSGGCLHEGGYCDL